MFPAKATVGPVSHMIFFQVGFDRHKKQEQLGESWDRSSKILKWIAVCGLCVYIYIYIYFLMYRQNDCIH